MGDFIPYVSLFSGAMGLDLGLAQSGFAPIVANEIDPAALETIKLNKPQLPVISDIITELNAACFLTAAGRNVEGISLVAGGPPCQPFSVFGNRRGTSDPRGAVVFDFVRMVLDIKPATFLLENVRGLHSMPLVRPTSSETPNCWQPAKVGYFC